MGPVNRITRRASRLATIYANTRVKYFQKRLGTFDNTKVRQISDVIELKGKRKKIEHRFWCPREMLE
jgi:hypothetical protein